jgi:isoquinoline 1-oxidoreductase subunit beta
VTGKAAYKIAFRQEPPAQKEGASMSTTALYERLRTAGAAARDVLTRAAAQAWNVDVAQCRTENGFVINARGEKLSYGQLAADAAKLRLSAAPPLKERSRFQLIGKPVPRLDTPAKCNGSAVFGIDVVVPGMLNAAIKTARSFSGEVTAIKNEADILKMPGVRAVVKLAALAIANEDAGAQHPRLPNAPRHNAVCVVADQFWQAQRALRALDVVFDGGTAGDLSTAKIDAMLDAALDTEHAVTALVRGQPREILQQRGAAVIERRFVLPHIAHAPLEPVNATASYKDGAVEVWGPIQSVTACQEAVAHAVGCAADDVKVNVTFLDVAEVVELARVAERFAVKRVFCAVDPGLVVNPNTLKAQIEGGIGFALTNTLKSRITFSNGGTDQSNFFDYQLLRIDEMPEIVPIVLSSDRPPQGFGEVVLAPVAPALAQALFGATGRRLDVMPFPEDAFRSNA